MRLLTTCSHLFQFLLYLVLLLLLSVPNVYSQSVVTSNQVAKEGDGEVVIPCDYSQVNETPLSVIWNEVNESGETNTNIIVNDVMTVNGRYSLRKSPGNADLVITKPVRNDTERRFKCEILLQRRKFIQSDPSMLTVYYLDEPVLSASASSVYEGESVTLTCSKPDGDPDPSITWYKDGQALSTTDTTRFTTSEDALEIHIEAATAADGGRYTCKAESDQFREEGKNSNQIDLKVIYIAITFESQGGTATCTAKGNPIPSSLMIHKNGEMNDKGELTASVKINEEICKADITCSAENGAVSATETLKTCKTVPSSCIALTTGMFFVGVFVGCIGLAAGLIGYFRIKQKKSEAMRSTDTRKHDTYMKYIADTSDENHTYQDLQHTKEETAYINARAGNYHHK
ncbi:junctional adhesion molecule A-like [Anneissia japonica]|uniref:junctional adhesion molecule A-like n=1 Tax=Anneissia japonica TaxID=1529436 RepID=UPI001425B0D1|nr:junctional adhesion molecule A-like [Anneissia japonica]